MSDVPKVNGQKVFHAMIQGEPASKANSRRYALINQQPRFIKSAKALSYAEVFGYQISKLRREFEPYECDVVFGARIYYGSYRPDLDESLILDLLQGVAYVNDRQVKCKLVFHDLDRNSPRSEIIVAPMSSITDVFDYIYGQGT